MKVLYITTAFPRYRGDPITPWLVKTIKNLKDKGIDVEVFTSSYKGSTYNRIDNIEVFRFRYFIEKFENLTHEEMTLERIKKGLIYKIMPVFYIIFGIIGIIMHCMKKKYDLIHVHWPFPHFIFGYIASKICHCKLISTFHGVGIRYIKHSSINLNKFLKWTIKNSDIITVNSLHTADELTPFNPEKIIIIPFGAAVENREKIKKIEEKEYCRILFVGRLVERKGVEYLINATSILKDKKNISVKLIIVGDGNRKEELMKRKNMLNLSDNDVIFKGRLNQNELIEEYRKCDIFVLPAIIDSMGDTEGLGVVLLEAMSFIKPVIASSVGGIVDIVKDGKTGILVREKSPEELTSAIDYLIKNPDKAKKIAETGYKFQNKNFSWESITRKLISNYKLLIKEN